MNFGPFTGWTSRKKVHLREGCSMVCISSQRKITTWIPVPLTLLSLERIEEGTHEVWLVEAADRGLYVTTHKNLTDPEALQNVGSCG